MKSERELLFKRLNELFVKAFATYHLLEDNDHVLVGLSGGKDSLFLLETLARRARISHPCFRVEAVHVRMKNINYETSTEYLEHFCKEWDVPLHIITTSFSTNKDILNTGRDTRRQKQPCFLCSWNRRKQLFNLAQQLGCNKIALGHHQDDLIKTALMNLTFQGRFDTMPARLQMQKMPLQIIRPLCMMQETDIKRYAELSHYEKQRKLCPYEHNSQRTSIQQLFDDMEHVNPDARHSLWNAICKAGILEQE